MTIIPGPDCALKKDGGILEKSGVVETGSAGVRCSGKTGFWRAGVNARRVSRREHEAIPQISYRFLNTC